MPRVSQLLFLGALVILVMVFAMRTGSSSPVTSTNVTQALQQKQAIAQLFVGHTSNQAYQAFIQKTNTLPFNAQHLAAHLFGEVLYEHDGLSGFSVCGSEFGYGCAHSFIGFALAEHGSGVAKELDDACLKNGPLALGCFHGLGHGAVTYYGYIENDLPKALSICDQLSWKGAYGGCREGVFMEYNLRTMLATDGGSNRSFDSSAPYAPCTSVAPSDQVSCYFGQGEWWRQSLTNAADVPRELGTLCAGVSGSENQKACFRGLGYAEAAPLNFAPEKGKVFCDAYSSISSSTQVWCREGYAWALYATNDKTGANLLCSAGLNAAASKECSSEYLFTILK